MANKLYPKGKEHFAKGDLAFLSQNIKCLLVTSGYTPNFTTDEFHSDVGGGNIVATSGNLASKACPLGVLNADPLVFTAVSGSTVTQVIMYHDSGVSGTSHIIAYWDTAAGLPVTPNGGDITLTWDTGTNKIAVI